MASKPSMDFGKAARNVALGLLATTGIMGGMAATSQAEAYQYGDAQIRLAEAQYRADHARCQQQFSRATAAGAQRINRINNSRHRRDNDGFWGAVERINRYGEIGSAQSAARANFDLCQARAEVRYENSMARYGYSQPQVVYQQAPPQVIYQQAPQPVIIQQAPQQPAVRDANGNLTQNGITVRAATAQDQLDYMCRQVRSEMAQGIPQSQTVKVTCKIN